MTQKISPAVFSSVARMASTMRRLSTSEIIHQLPEAPPPPNEPPPPEKPPPPPDQEEPDDPHEPGIGMKTGPPEPRRRPAPICAYPRPCLATLRTIIKKINKKNTSARKSTKLGWSSGRFLARAFHSSASTDTAWMMSSTH